MKNFIFSAIFCLFFQNISCQTYWNVQIDQDSMQLEYINALSLSDDGNIIFGGGSVIPNISYKNFYGKLNATNGDKIFEYFYPPTGGIANIISINSGVFSILESTASNPLGSQNIQTKCVKIENISGNILWEKEIGENDKSELLDSKLLFATKKKFVIVGAEGGVDSIIYIKILFNIIDSLGNLEYSKTYSLNPLINHFGQSITETEDKGFLILGFNKFIDFNYSILDQRDMIILKIDSVGNLINTHKYSANQINKNIAYLGTDIIKKKDGNFLICGFKEYQILGQEAFSSRYMYATINSNGELLDSVSYQWHFSAYPRRIISTNDGNFLTCGYERNKGINPKYGMLMKVSQDMKILWKRLYRTSPPNAPEHDEFKDVIEMPDDHGFVLCASSYRNDSTKQNGWVIRVDSLGCLVPGCDTILSTATPIPETAAGIAVFPNPTTDEITVETEATVLGYRVVDFSGRVVEDVQFLRELGVKKFEISLGSAAAGVYMLAVRTEHGWLVKKVVKT